MKSSLLILVIIIGTLIVIASCKKPDEVKVKEEKVYTLLQDDLARSMKKASLVMRRVFLPLNVNPTTTENCSTRTNTGLRTTPVRLPSREANNHGAAQDLYSRTTNE